MYVNDHVLRTHHVYFLKKVEAHAPHGLAKWKKPLQLINATDRNQI